MTDLNNDYSASWDRATELLGIPKEAYAPKLKVLRDLSGRSDYTFLAHLNPHRANRIKQRPNGCLLCKTFEKIVEEKELNLGEIEENMIVYPNAFPFTRGASLAIPREHRPLYSTSNPGNLEEELKSILDFGSRKGLRMAHNYRGFGASISEHEHYHLFNLGSFFEQEGAHGFENAEVVMYRGSNAGFMPSFPFAHIVISQDDPGLVEQVVRRAGNQLGNRFDNGEVPHCLVEGEKGILFAPAKVFDKKARGANDIAGIWYCKDQQELEEASFEKSMKYLFEHLFTREELDLKKFI